MSVLQYDVCVHVGMAFRPHEVEGQLLEGLLRDCDYQMQSCSTRSGKPPGAHELLLNGSCNGSTTGN